MIQTLSLKEVIGRGVELKHYEAIAVVQELIRNVAPGAQPTAPLGPPSLETVHLGADGSVVCHSCATTPAVFEIAILLDLMLPRGGHIRVPGAVRYAIARALLEVDALPFDSVAELSAVLERYKRGSRSTVLADVYARAARTIRGSCIGGEERRKTGPSVTALRQQLREADEALFGALEQQLVPDAPHPMRTPGFSPAGALPVEIEPRQWRRGVDAPRGYRAAAAAAVLLSLALGYYSTVHLLRPATTVQPGVAALPSSAIAAPVFPAVVQGLERRLTSRPPVSVFHVRPRVDSHVPPLASTPLGTSLVSAARRSPDAHSAVQAGDFTGRDLEVMTIADDGARNSNVQASPDGALVAFDSDRDGERGVYLATRSGTGVHRVSGIGPAAAPTWSPDAKTVALVRAETDRPHVWNLWLLDIETGAMRRLTAFRTGETSRAAWFTDGRRVCYSHDDRIVVHDLLAATTATYDSPVPGRLVSNPAISPDGRRVIFQVEGRGAWLLDQRDGSTRCILNDPTAEAFAWSADGRRAAYYSRRDDGWGGWIMAPSS
jgi:hypothetical protein